MSLRFNSVRLWLVLRTERRPRQKLAVRSQFTNLEVDRRKKERRKSVCQNNELKAGARHGWHQLRQRPPKGEQESLN